MGQTSLPIAPAHSFSHSPSGVPYEVLNRVRKPETQSSLQSKLLMVAGALLLGVCLGTFSKYLDYRQATLPGILQQIDASLDLHNFLGTFAPWVVVAVFLSIKSPSPFQASANVFAFFTGMVASYYLYSNYVAGFFPKSYAMIWMDLRFFLRFWHFSAGTPREPAGFPL